MPSPFDDLADLEAAFKALFFGRFSGGLFGRVRKPPQEVIWLVSRGESGAVLASDWWRSIFGRAEGRQVVEFDGRPIGAPHATEAEARAAAGAHGIEAALVRIAGEAALGALVEAQRIQAPRERALSVAQARRRRRRKLGLPGRRAAELAEAIARERIAELIRFLKESTGAGLRQVVIDLAARDLTLAELREELYARLGPTRKQMGAIRRWERKQIEAGVPRRKILSGIKSRTRNAIRRRVGGTAQFRGGIVDWEFTRQVNAARDAVFADQGLQVVSDDQHDKKVRALHSEQSRATQAAPVPAGQPWPPEAPFREGPPYEAGCRCFRRAVAG